MSGQFSGKHASIDLETMDLKSTAVILSIGLVVFDFSGMIHERHIFHPSIAEQLTAGRTVDQSTMAWWAKQSPEAAGVFDVPRDTVRATLVDIADVTADLDGVWGFGADFDNVKLMDLGMQFDTAPYHYRKNRCGRTLISLAEGFKWPEDGVAQHNALADAEVQAEAYVRAARVIAGLKP